MKKHIIGEKRLKVGDTAVLYVTTCSDVNPSFKHSRRLLECVVVGKIKGFTRDEDDRYIIRCSEDLRTEHVKTGAYADEAIASKYSPFLMTWEEYENYKKDFSYKVGDCFSISNYKVVRILKNLNYIPVFNPSDIAWNIPSEMLDSNNNFIKSGNFEITANYKVLSLSFTLKVS